MVPQDNNLLLVKNAKISHKTLNIMFHWKNILPNDFPSLSAGNLIALSSPIARKTHFHQTYPFLLKMSKILQKLGIKL